MKSMEEKREATYIFIQIYAYIYTFNKNMPLQIFLQVKKKIYGGNKSARVLLFSGVVEMNRRLLTRQHLTQ